ncbi:MAG TPA: hypothetical protein VFI31_26155 [Pirellulales bacterium]|nr:hypothetical protein [Pirellulales bacterium]
MTEDGTNEPPSWRTFFRRVFTNIEPIVEHAIAVVVLESSVLVVGLVALLLKRWLASQERFVDILEQVDIVFAIVFLCIFGAHATIGVSIRSFQSLRDEWNRK